MKFRKKQTETTLSDIEDLLLEVRMRVDRCESDIEKIREALPAMVREHIISLARSESIHAVTLYRDEEFLTKVVEDKKKELKHKKLELENALNNVEAALATVEDREGKQTPQGGMFEEEE